MKQLDYTTGFLYVYAERSRSENAQVMAQARASTVSSGLVSKANSKAFLPFSPSDLFAPYHILLLLFLPGAGYRKKLPVPNRLPLLLQLLLLAQRLMLSLRSY